MTCRTITALEINLQQSLSHVKDLELQFEQLILNSDNYKIQYIEQKEKCESKNCSGSQTLKNVIAAKDKIIDSVESALTRLSETRNFNILNDIYKILRGETANLTPPSESEPVPIKIEPESQVYSPEKLSPIAADVSVKEESLLEIEGTPTGRVSPIIQTRKFHSGTNISKTNSSDFKEKKKCPDSWPTPETKSVKMSYQTPTRNKPNGRLRQTRLPLTKIKPSNTVDLTSSPEFSGGSRLKTETVCNVQVLIKKESIESDDTILPSPTSGPTSFLTLYKTTSKASPKKFKTPLSLIRDKPEKLLRSDKCGLENQNQPANNSNAMDIEDSINLLQPNRGTIKRKSPKTILEDDNITHCETNDSVSLLQHLNMLEGNEENIRKQSIHCSPNRQPLAENINLLNTPEKDIHIDSSMSLLRPELVPPKSAQFDENVKRKIPEHVEPIYKEPTVRKKAEKLALPGWSCDECRDFYDELYRDNPVMLAKKMDECSKHRGRNNPARPKTPTGFWNPRWDVPEDTEEFNKRNNAA
ncbi:uncharacterized protein ACR2FA_003301 [Aphomia sociella]